MPAATPPGGPRVVRGIGVDAVDVARFRAVLDRRPSIAGRLFTGGELEYARRAVEPTERLAARFAAKEAVLKALGAGLGAADFREVEVRRREDGAPSLTLTGRAAHLASRRGVDRWHLSLTHVDRLAIANVVAEGPPGPDEPGGDVGEPSDGIGAVR